MGAVLATCGFALLASFLEVTWAKGVIRGSALTTSVVASLEWALSLLAVATMVASGWPGVAAASVGAFVGTLAGFSVASAVVGDEP